jgi:predicted AlkP superfamily pyrophosphatase or phosphodiesterase
MNTWRKLTARLLCAGLAAAGVLIGAPAQSLLLISIDGMRPDYVTRADKHGLKIPVLRQMLKEGAHAEGVDGVVPTVTYPSHTTILTGVWPREHGIQANTIFDPESKNLEGWYWYTEDIKVQTLWAAARAAGLKTASVNWPVSVGAPVDYLIPEVWRAGSPEDHKLVRALSTPGMLAGLEAKLGPYADELNTDLPNDRLRAKFSMAILRDKKPHLMTVHLAALDHAEHMAGPFSKEANEVLEGSDELIGQLREAALSADPKAIVCVVSDHGFAEVKHHFNVALPFIEAGLIKGGRKNRYGGPAVESWKAMPWISGGSAAVVLKDAQDAAARTQTEELLKKLAADPANGINRIVDHDELMKLGGFPEAAFLIDMKPGYQIAFSLSGPLSRETKEGGTHGYLPEHPELRAAFFIAGPGIAKGKDLGVIDMRQIAPTLAQILNVRLAAARAEVLPLQ